MSKRSYQMITKIDDQYKSTLVSELKTAVQGVFGCLLLNPDDIISRLLEFAEQVTNYSIKN